jgi:hypothetical protein
VPWVAAVVVVLVVVVAAHQRVPGANRQNKAANPPARTARVLSRRAVGAKRARDGAGLAAGEEAVGEAAAGVAAPRYRRAPTESF